MIRYVKTYAAVLAAILALDAVWLGLVARQFYADRLGHLTASSPNWAAAAAFYPIYALGVLALVVWPAIRTGSLFAALWRGAVFGFMAYATYNLTNLATLRDWPPEVSAVDIAWGTFVTTVAGLAGYVAGRLVQPARQP
jgi:uncharacterized membrane protein